MMEKHCESGLFKKIENPQGYVFGDYAGEEVLVGLEGFDQYGNKCVNYISGIIGFRDEAQLELGLYEYVKGRKGKANLIMPLTARTPIVELIIPLRIEKEVQHHERGREGELEYTIVSGREDRNSTLRDTFHVKLKSQ